MAKDLGLAAHAAEPTGVDAALGLRAAEIYERLAADGGAGQDFSAIINDIRDRSEHRRDDRMSEISTSYETILVERQGRVGIITLNRPEGAQRAQPAADAARWSAAARGVRPRSRRSAASCSPDRSRPSRPAPTSRRCSPAVLHEMYLADWFAAWDALAAVRTPIDRRRGRLRPRRRLRAGDDVRHHHRRRHREVRPAGDQARRHPRHGRLPAADPRGRQVQGHGDCASPAGPWTPRRPNAPGWCPGSCPPPTCSTRRSTVAATIAAMSQAGRDDGEGERSTAPTRPPSPRACASNAGSSTPCSPPRTRRRAWPPSSRSGRPTSPTAERHRDGTGPAATGGPGRGAGRPVRRARRGPPAVGGPRLGRSGGGHGRRHDHRPGSTDC